jgi:hypothetical protein
MSGNTPTSGGAINLEGRDRSWKIRWSDYRSYWRHERKCGALLYFGLMLVLVTAPSWVVLAAGPAWGRGTAVVCGAIWFFCYDRGLGLYALLIHQFGLLALLVQFHVLNHICGLLRGA